MWCMEFGVNTKYLLGLPWAAQIGFQHEEKTLRTMNTTNPLIPPPPPVTMAKDLMFFFKGFPNWVLPFLQIFKTYVRPARDLEFWHNVHHPLCVMWHLSYVRSQELKCWEKVHLFPPVTCQMSCVMCHVSCVMGHTSCATFFPLFFRTKWWSFWVEVLLLTGPTPSS